MKKILFALLAVSMLAFVACSKDEDGSPAPQVDPTITETPVDFTGMLFKDSTTTVTFTSATEGEVVLAVNAGPMSVTASASFSYTATGSLEEGADVMITVDKNSLTIDPEALQQVANGFIPDQLALTYSVDGGKSLIMDISVVPLQTVLHYELEFCESVDFTGMTFADSTTTVNFTSATEGNITLSTSVPMMGSVQVDANFTYKAYGSLEEGADVEITLDKNSIVVDNPMLEGIKSMLPEPLTLTYSVSEAKTLSFSLFSVNYVFTLVEN